MLAGPVLTDALILTDKVGVPTHVDTLWHKLADWKLARFHAQKKQIGDSSWCETQSATWDEFSATFSNVSVWTEQVESQIANPLKGLSLFCLNRQFPALWNQIANPRSLTRACRPNISSQSMCFSIVPQTAGYCVTQPQYAKYVQPSKRPQAEVWTTWEDK